MLVDTDPLALNLVTGIAAGLIAASAGDEAEAVVVVVDVDTEAAVAVVAEVDEGVVVLVVMEAAEEAEAVAETAAREDEVDVDGVAEEEKDLPDMSCTGLMKVVPAVDVLMVTPTFLARTLLRDSGVGV
ncbi:hypothetical protein BaRGS_00001467 [Batillaria attramentaria]|uniref:Secreted protein n=1 Tax=Batillaria attramentaria TaxID=370345 RepID=A0ABD0M7N2_9CAEN|nr:hypothetical protein BaRGS_000442 [Batillaria attramentaria]